MKKKILCLIDSLQSGGAERQMSYLATGLKQAGHDVKLVIFSKETGFYEEDVLDGGVEVNHNIAGINKIKRIGEIRNLVKQDRPDAVITYKDGVCMAACLARLLTKFNLIVSERNTTQILSKKERLKFFLYRFADHIVPNSFSQKDFIDRHYPSLSRKCTVITNVINSEKFQPSLNRKETDVPTVLTTARLTEQKNILNYLDAISILSKKGVKANFKWYGRSDMPQYAKQVQDKVQKLGLVGIIEFHENVSDVVALYQAADLFCLPSTYEGFPNVLCEAMSSGLVCMASRVCDNPSILNDEKRLFNPSSPEDIAEVLENTLNIGKEQNIEEGKRNRKRIVELCSSETFIRKYESLL